MTPKGRREEKPMKQYDYEKTFRRIKRSFVAQYGYAYKHALIALREGNIEAYGKYFHSLMILTDFAESIGYDTAILIHASCNMERFVK